MDSARPFPLIRNKTLNIGALIAKKNKKNKEELEFATVQVPLCCRELWKFPVRKKEKSGGPSGGGHWEEHRQVVFKQSGVCACPYRIIRNADLTIDEDEAADLLNEIQKQLKKRQWGEVIRLDVNEKMDARLLNILKTEF